MPVLVRMLASPLTLEVRSGAIAVLPALLADRRISSGGHVAVAVGRGQGEQVLRTLNGTLTNGSIHRVDAGTVEVARELAVALSSGSYDAVVGIGGGRTLDVAKYAASLAGLPSVSVATSLAHDGIASPVASLEHNGHKRSYGVQMPLAVIVDLEYVRRCPVRLLRAGIGDALSNLGAVADWELAVQARGEPIDGVAAALARSAAESVLHRTDDVREEDFLTTLAHAFALSGLAMAAAGSSRPCSGACHEIAHALDELYAGDRLHGEEVAVGMLFAAFLRGGSLVEELDACLRRYGVPRLPSELGLTAEQFAAAVGHAPSTRPDRYTVLEDLQMDEHEIQRRVDDFIATFDR
jgi:glycerol-1-phosphate dehydrogenase [NAD(P)+]